MALTDDLMRIPGVARFMETLRDDLAKRHSVLLLMPSSVNQNDVWLLLHAELGAAFDIHEIELPILQYDNSVASLGQSLQKYWGLPITPYTLADLMECAGLPDVLHLSSLEQLPLEGQQAWIEFLVQWARASQQKTDRNSKPMALCLPVYAAQLICPPPEPDVFLSVRWWQGIPSLLDMRVLCRLQNTGTETRLLSQWREYLLPALASSDVSLAAYLWDKLDGPLDKLMEALCEFAHQKGWTASCIPCQQCEPFLTATHRDYASVHSLSDRYWQSLWANEILCYTPEMGWELHTAALAILGMRDMVQHRLWRGQVTLLLPLIDATRLRICQHLTETYGPQWPLWMEPEEERERQLLIENPRACQLGHLQKLLRHHPSLNAEHRWLSVVYEATYIRNQIAHYRAVTFDDFRRFDEAARSIY